MTKKRIAVIPGDGIGIDVTREALKVLDVVTGVTGAALAIEEFDFGRRMRTMARA